MIKNSSSIKLLLMFAGVVDLADSMDLGSITLMVCGFESRRPHQNLYNPNPFPVGNGFGLLALWEIFMMSSLPDLN